MDFSVSNFLAYLNNQFPNVANGSAAQVGRREKKLAIHVVWMIKRHMEDNDDFEIDEDENDTLEIDAVYEECRNVDDGNTSK